MEKNPNENDTLGSSCIARISELKQEFLILECEKCEVKDKLSSCMEGLIINLKLRKWSRKWSRHWYCEGNLPRTCNDGSRH